MAKSVCKKRRKFCLSIQTKKMDENEKVGRQNTQREYYHSLNLETRKIIREIF